MSFLISFAFCINTLISCSIWKLILFTFNAYPLFCDNLSILYFTIWLLHCNARRSPFIWSVIFRTNLTCKSNIVRNLSLTFITNEILAFYLLTFQVRNLTILTSGFVTFYLTLDSSRRGFTNREVVLSIKVIIFVLITI